MAYGLAQGFDFYLHAQPGQVFQFFQGDGRHPKAALPFAGDQGVAGQPGDGFAQRACAHAVLAAQVLDAQLAARL